VATLNTGGSARAAPLDENTRARARAHHLSITVRFQITAATKKGLESRRDGPASHRPTASPRTEAASLHLPRERCHRQFTAPNTPGGYPEKYQQRHSAARDVTASL